LKIGGEYLEESEAVGGAIEELDYSGGESTDDEHL
jgi:hypothetical protein